MIRKSALLRVLLVTLPVAGACASSGTSSGIAESCTSDLASHDRSIDEVVDSATLARGLAGLWRANQGLTLARIVYDSTGADTAFVVAAIAPPLREAMAREIGRHVRPGAFTGEVVRLYVGGPSGPAPRRVRDLVTCPPEILHRDVVTRMMAQEAARLDFISSTTVLLMALVQEDGTVGEVRIERSSTNMVADAAAVGIIRRTTFAPGRVEGIPTPIWVSFPVTFQVPRRRAR